MCKVPFIVLTLLMLVFSLTGCNNGPEDTQELKSIIGSAVTQGPTNEKGETRVVVAVRNNNYKQFNGLIKVASLGDDRKSFLGFDAFPVSPGPGKTTFEITWLKVANVPCIQVEVADGRFNHFIK